MATEGRSRATAERRDAILAAASDVLAEHGYAGATMLAIARRARASKETLYAWFGDKAGLMSALVLANARDVNDVLGRRLLDGDADPRDVLTAFAVELQRLLLGERALVVNRAAIAVAARDPSLGRILVAHGRDRTVPRLVHYLETQRAAGRLAFDDAARAVDVLVGLVIGDQQVRRLLGVLPMPSAAEIEDRAASSVAMFMALFGAGDAP